MLDIELFRKDPEKIRESEIKRGKGTENVEKVIDYDKRWKEVLEQVNELRRKRNQIDKEIAKTKNKGLIPKVRQINKKITEFQDKEKNLREKRDSCRYKVGNILHKSVPEGDSEDNNELIRKWGVPKRFGFKPVGHADIVDKLGLADTEKAAEVVGSRFFYMKGALVLMNLALQQFALQYLIKKGFLPAYTPFMLNHESMAGASELSDFEQQLYKIEKEPLYLIATSEQTLAAYHKGEILEPDQLPIKYAGISTCFRREAGSHGKDTKGIFRVHQFDKVEQFVFCKAEDSPKFFKELVENAEFIFKELGIPYRIVNICAGEMNDNASLKYDLELWFPAQNRYREVVSVSNCTDYQARKLGIRMRHPEKNVVVHTLNGTAVATQRTLTAILENYQKEDGSVKVPKVLQPYLGFKTIGIK